MKYQCNCCENFMRTIAVFLDGSDLVLVVPERTFENYERLCLCIAQSIPATSTQTPVEIQSGYSATPTRYPLLDIAGNPIYSYQLRCRRKYPVTVSTATPSLVIHQKHLEKSSSVLGGGSTPSTASATTKSGGSKNG